MREDRGVLFGKACWDDFLVAGVYCEHVVLLCVKLSRDTEHCIVIVLFICHEDAEPKVIIDLN